MVSGNRDNPPPRVTLGELTFPCVFVKFKKTICLEGARQLGCMGCLTSAGRVTLTGGTTLLHINTLARLTGTSVGVANLVSETI